MQSTTQSSSWSPSDDNNIDNPAYELHWVRVGVNIFVAALYHPPRPTYKTEDLLDYIEHCIAEITHDFPLADIIFAGDLNQLSDQSLVERTGLFQIVYQPTRGGNILDRIFVSNPQLYCIVRVVTSIVSSVIGADLQRSTHSSYGTSQAWTSEILVQQLARIRPLIHRLSLIISTQQHSGFSTNFTQSILSR